MKKIFLMIAMVSALTIAAKAQIDNSKTAYNQTLNAYFQLKNALATDRADLAAAGAKKLLTSIKDFPVKTLTGPQQAEWETQATAIQKYALPIVKEKELKLQRKSFEGLASAMLKLARTMNLNSSPIYVQYCPMVKRSWLNEVEAVQNPFYGKQMYDCGEVTETISKK